MISREFPPFTPYTGGIGRQFAALASGLVKLGHEVDVVAVGLESETGPANISGLRAKRRPPGLGAVADALMLRRRLPLARPYDILYAPEWGGDAAFVRRGNGCAPLVTSLHMSLAIVRAVTPDTRLAGELRPSRRVQSALERRQAQRSDAIIAPTRAVLDRSRELWDISGLPTAILPNCVDIDGVRAVATAGSPPPGFPDGCPVVTFSGRLEGRKGVQVLVSAMRLVWQDLPDVRLVLLGADGGWQRSSMTDHLRSLAGEDIARISFLGDQPPERVFPALVASTIVALPSLWENFPLAALEAMAIGCPVVATSGSGYDDFIESGANGLLVEQNSAESLADGLSRLLRNPGERLGIGEAAAASVARFDAHDVAAQHAAFLATLG